MANGEQMESLRSRLKPTPPIFTIDGRAVAAAAAVVVARTEGGPAVLLIERNLMEDDPWSGHVAFPGGRREALDGSPLATAIRETQEEVGLTLTADQCLGHLGPWTPRTRPEALVVPLVFHLPAPVPTGRSQEARASFWAELGMVASSAGRSVQSTSLGPLEVPSFSFHGRTIWGFTYRVLLELLGLLGYKVMP